MTPVAFTEAESDYIVEIGKSVTGRVEWADHGADLRAALRVDNDQGQHIELRLRLARRAPDKLHVVLVWQQRPIRRLDVRDNHVNPDRSETWQARTHKHRWTDDHRDRQAYTPEEFPPTDGRVAPGEYRLLVEAFCRECNIDARGLDWVEPDLGEEAS